MAAVFALLAALAILSQGCANAVAAGSLTALTAMDATTIAAEAGKTAHIARLGTLEADVRAFEAEVVAKRLELGCGPAGTAPESYPAGCKVSEWNTYRLMKSEELAPMRAAVAGEVERFGKFEAVVTTTKEALKTAARVLIEIDAGKRSKLGLADVLAVLVDAYRNVVTAVRAWGVEPPAIPGL